MKTKEWPTLEWNWFLQYCITFNISVLNEKKEKSKKRDQRTGDGKKEKRKKAEIKIERDKV